MGETANSTGIGTSALVSSILSDAASVTNTAIIANANPVNAAILTNTPLTTPGAVVGGVPTSMGTWLVLAVIAVVIVIFASR